MRITEHIHMLNLPFRVPVAPGIELERSVNVFLIAGDTGLCLVDAGTAGAEGAVFEYLRSLGRAPGEIGMLLLTHSHPDHMGAARAVCGAAGCTVAAHGAERDWIEDTEKQFRERPVPGFPSLVEGPVQVDRVLADGDRVDVGGVTLEVIHTPGHSRGSVSLLVVEDGALIAGDAVPVPGDIPIYDDAAATVRSLERLRAVPKVGMLLSSWDVPRRGDGAARALEDGLAWVRRIHETVTGVAAEGPEFVPAVMEALGLPVRAANPLVARTFLAHRAVPGLFGE